VGQCAKEKARIVVQRAWRLHPHPLEPGRCHSVSIVVSQLLFEGDVKALIELLPSGNSATFTWRFRPATQSIGIVLTHCATMRTEQLLLQSSVAEELQSQQLQLQKTNAGIARKGPTAGGAEGPRSRPRTRKWSRPRSAGGESGTACIDSKYKSEFLANMSHELRTAA